MPHNDLGFDTMNRRRQILIVEDDDASRQLLKSSLEGHYDLIISNGDQNALEMVYAHRETLSLVLLELMLPDGQGQEILRRLKNDPLLAGLPVIVITSDRAAEAGSLNCGAMDFILKPYLIPEVVLARVHHAIELSEDRSIIRSIERDQLTGLYNKDFFFSYAEQYDTYHKDLDMDALVVNINHFHMINERYGKNYGDDVLRRIGTKIRDAVGDRAIVCRRENDNFLVYCPHRGDYERILERTANGMDSRVRLRMGVYARVDKSLDIERRFDRAKVAADTVRNSFTKIVGVYDDAMHDSEIYVEQLLEDFPRAIEEKQFVVVYQPKFDIRAAEPVLSSSEALVRWNHPRLGLISPGSFIPLFESNGLIQQLDSYVWREVAAQMKDWKTRLGVCLPVSVNVSRVDMLDPDLVEHMQKLVQEFDLSPEEFLLEITESAYTEDSDRIIQMVNRFREAGFQIEMDDFGSGYSSLNMIATMPVDALKLDMQFLHNAFKERKNTRMLDVVIDIACSLQVSTIAEGVETAEQMFALKAMGCDIVQGYYFSKPIPPSEFERYLLEWKASGEQTATGPHRGGSAKTVEEFTYDALHDPQTGLYNHSAYKMLLKDSDQHNIALLLADVDDYDYIRQKYGSQAVDRVAARVAEVLRHNFRSVDFICRISNDEFVVIMTRVNSGMRKLVYDKVEQVNTMLRQQEEGMPQIGLSVGVAFADRENPQGDIFHDADIALSRMKDMKRSGCAIY